MKHFSFISGLLFIGFISVNSSAQIMGGDNCIDYEEINNTSSYDQSSESSDESISDAADRPDSIDYPEDYFDEGGGIRTLDANDRSFYGTDGDDTIYFGYCHSCGDRWTEAIVICGWDDYEQDYVVLDKLDFACSPDCGILEIDGQDGNDYIEFISNRELNSACEFEDSSVIYSEFVEVDILGHTGNDTVIGNSDIDYMTGYDGYDSLYGNGGGDYIWGGDEDDYIVGGDGDDTIYGSDGNDYLNGGNGNDNIYGGNNNDKIEGGDGNDYIYGDRSTDAYPGNDFLVGGGGNDYIYGWNGNDYIQGNSNDDNLYGQNGNDVIVGGTGLDNIYGGDGSDIFWCRSSINADPVYDGINASEDCIDGTKARDSIEATRSQDPYTQWANLINHGSNWNGYNYGMSDEIQTTSNKLLLVMDRAAGASILLPVEYTPFAIDSNNDGKKNDVAMLNVIKGDSVENYIYFDHGHDCLSINKNYYYKNFTAGDRPVAGAFNGSYKNDIGFYRPSDRLWRYDYDRNGTIDYTSPNSWGLAGDIPFTHNIDKTGYDGVGVFRPSSRYWYFDNDRNGTTDTKLEYDPNNPNWIGTTGDIPIIGNFDNDSYEDDDIGVYRPSTGMWYYDTNVDGTIDSQSGPWPSTDRNYCLPFVGDFDDDSDNDDLGVYNTKTETFYYDYDHDGDSDGPSYTCFDSSDPVHAKHKQYDSSCGPTSLNMVLEYLGVADDPTQRLFYTYDMKNYPQQLTKTDFDNGDAVDVGHFGSMEDIMYEGHYREWKNQRYNPWPPLNNWDEDMFCITYDPNSPDYYKPCDDYDHLNTADFVKVAGITPDYNNAWPTWPTKCDDNPNTPDPDCRSYYDYLQIDYEIEYMNDDPNTPDEDEEGAAQAWLYYHPGVGWGSYDYTWGQPWVVNNVYMYDYYWYENNYAIPINTYIDGNCHNPNPLYHAFDSLTHLKEAIRGFIDNNIPVVIAVDSGGHFNTLVGYWDRGSYFYIYTADPLDGYGHGFWEQRMRWRKILISSSSLIASSGTFGGFLRMARWNNGCAVGNWAERIDYNHTCKPLCYEVTIP